MLVLTRKEKEGFWINVPGLKEPIHIVVAEFGRNKVRIGIDAPRDCIVLRDELMPEERNKT